jgi:eukaryotic-like serine/threonine-protein kinase
MNESPTASLRPATPNIELLENLVEEISNKLLAGESVESEAYAAQYPEYADQIRDLLPALRVLAGASQHAESPLEGSPSGSPAVQAGLLGDFRIVREVGRGGMGIVYEAEQISLGRRVALKVLPFAATMDPRHLQRFQNEARSAASLEHPHIVPVYGVGCERGVHYYAMKFIDGRTVAALIAAQRQDSEPAQQPTQTFTAPISAPNTTPHAQDATAPAPRDAAYFRRAAEWGIQAAEALEHAHSLGIVHRDIKPANLIINRQGKLWITDFGLARIGSDAGLTMTGDVLGTLRYMSPEQAQAQHGLVDHRTDVYSLGVTLYELLTLRPAFEGEDRAKIVQAIGLEDPTPPRRIDRRIPAELETIVLKAMEKNPGERYATAKKLAEDLRRWLEDKPIVARRPGLLQQSIKWSQRHRSMMASAMAILILAVIALSVSNLIIARANEKKDLALRAAKEATAAAKQSDTETKAVLDFVEKKVFAAARPEGLEGGLGREVKLRQALEAALPYVGKNFSDQPLTEARLRRTVGLSFRYLGDEKIAAEQFETACLLYREHLGLDHPDTLACMNNLANSYAALGLHPKALQLREETLARRRAILGDEHPDTLASMSNLATSYDVIGKHGEALRLREETLGGRIVALGPEDSDTLASMNNLAVSYTLVGRHADAATLLGETLPLMKINLPPDHPRTLATMHNLAESYHALRRHADALKLYEETLDLRTKKLGPKHRDTLLTMNNLAWLLCTAADVQFRDPKRAVELAATAAELSSKNADFWGTLGTARYRAGDYRQAADALEKAIRLRGADDSRNANESFFLAMAHLQLGDKPGAREAFDQAIEWMDKNESRNDEVRRFREEAEEVLGIK